MNQPENGKRVWVQIALLAAFILAVSAALWYWREPLWEFFNNQEQVQAWIQGFGPWAPVVSIALNAAQVLAAPIPGQIIGIANGYMYGLWMGTLYSMIGSVVGRALAMLLGYRLAVFAFVPASALAMFTPAWFVAAMAQPASALSFITDGIHWGTGDYRYLRNAVAVATFCGCVGLILLDENRPGALTWVWLITGGWIVVRALLGMIRIWPGIGNSPLAGNKAIGQAAAAK